MERVISQNKEQFVIDHNIPVFSKFLSKDYCLLSKIYPKLPRNPSKLLYTTYPYLKFSARVFKIFPIFSYNSPNFLRILINTFRNFTHNICTYKLPKISFKPKYRLKGSWNSLNFFTNLFKNFPNKLDSSTNFSWYSLKIPIIPANVNHSQ